MIEAALPDDPEGPASWPVFAALLPHAQAALDPASDNMLTIARYLGETGSYAAALTVQQRSCKPGRRPGAPSAPIRWPPAPTWPTGPGKRGTRPWPGTSTPRCCPSENGSWAPSTPRRS